MNTQNKDHGRFIHISNIPVEATEHELRQLFSTVAQIVSFEFENQTSRHTRTARLEFHDAETAAVAIQQFDGHTIKRKQLIITPLDRFASKPSMQQIIGSNVPRNSASRLPQGSKTAINDTQIYNIVASMTEREQAEILVEFKNLATNHPEQMRQLLIDSPQFAHTILTLMTIFQLVDQEAVETFNVQRQQSALPTTTAPQPQRGGLTMGQVGQNQPGLSEREQRFYERWQNYDETTRQKVRDISSAPIETLEGGLQNAALIFRSIEFKLNTKL